MGLLELDLPPIQFHASTQCRHPHRRQKARFLQDVGFSQMVLARELSLEQNRSRLPGQTTRCTLEFFVHGALCVSLQRPVLHQPRPHTGRSANRGECSQACRLPYDADRRAGSSSSHTKQPPPVDEGQQPDRQPAKR
jgi:collagenase-like PrtC family protease